MQTRHPIQIWLSTDMKDWLQHYAQRHDMTMTAVLKFLLERERLIEKRASPHDRPLYDKRPA